jgi:hypothetical protein
MDLILHVGLPKTATTSLQLHMFPQFPEYLGKLTGTGIQSALGARATSEWLAQTPEWRDRVQDWIRQLEQSDLRRAIFSEELLSQWPGGDGALFWPVMDDWQRFHRARPHPLQEFIDEVRKAGSGELRVRIIVAIRNQSQFLASLYAQLEGHMARPGQEDFESKVRGLIRQNDPFCDWASFIEELVILVGRDNLLLLLHEDGVEQNVARMGSFLGTAIDTSGIEQWRENVKAQSSQQWKGVRRETPVTQRGCLGATRRRIRGNWPTQWADPVVLKRVVRRFDRWASKAFPPRIEGGLIISLSDELASEIRKHYKPSNKQLCAHVGRDLAQLGY